MNGDSIRPTDAKTKGPLVGGLILIVLGFGILLAQFTDSGGGKFEFKAAGTTITVDSSGVSVQTPSKVKVQASQVDVSAGMVKCEILQTNTVIATTYTPGAGNVW